MTAGAVNSMRQAGEPSVEQILESVKKVIARDNKLDTSASLKPKRASHSDVLELTNPIEEGNGLIEDLIADATAGSMRKSLGALSILAEPRSEQKIAGRNEGSLEGLVRELSRPMLGKWLEQNLPAMVEKMVAAEIARIASKRR